MESQHTPRAATPSGFCGTTVRAKTLALPPRAPPLFLTGPLSITPPRTHSSTKVPAPLTPDHYAGPELIDNTDLWQWNRILDEDSPFFKNHQPEIETPRPEEKPEHPLKPCTIFLPKFKDFVYNDTDCSLGEMEEEC